MITPSQLVNNYLVRAGVKYFVKEEKVRKDLPFIVFLLLHSDGSLQKARIDSDIDGAELEKLKIETKKITKPVNVVPTGPKRTQPQVQTNTGTLSAFKTIRVPHTYNGILTVIATVKVPVSQSQ